MKKLQTVTLGCSKNKVDTEHILSYVENLMRLCRRERIFPLMYF